MQDPLWAQKLRRTIRNVFGQKQVPVPNDFPIHKRQAHAAWVVPEIRTVIDVGAHIGEFAQMVRSFLPEAQIFSFEPLSESHEVLRQAMAHDDRWSSFRVALGDVPGVLRMYKNAFTPCSSLLPMTFKGICAVPYTLCARREEVEVQRLDDILNIADLEDDILLKIDTQGYEDRVLKGAENILGRTKYILIEVSFIPIYQGQKLFPDIKAMLESRGFRLERFVEEMKSSFHKGVIQADALFVRD